MSPTNRITAWFDFQTTRCPTLYTAGPFNDIGDFDRLLLAVLAGAGFGVTDLRWLPTAFGLDVRMGEHVSRNFLRLGTSFMRCWERSRA